MASNLEHFKHYNSMVETNELFNQVTFVSLCAIPLYGYQRYRQLFKNEIKYRMFSFVDLTYRLVCLPPKKGRKFVHSEHKCSLYNVF